MAWLHIQAKTECSIGSSNEEEEGGHFGGDEEEEDGLQVLLGPHMAQTPLLSPRRVLLRSRATATAVILKN
eukprot:11435862-Ditylum_brightwellii.AAC.1